MKFLNLFALMTFLLGTTACTQKKEEAPPPAPVEAAPLDEEDYLDDDMLEFIDEDDSYGND
jgi:hypothetical protein